MHFLTVFWKVLFACVPPTEYCNGWACFIVSILIIGMLTAIIGDLASHFGCTIGLKDSVTAVVFVAFGTSVPGEETVGKNNSFAPGSFLTQDFIILAIAILNESPHLATMTEHMYVASCRYIHRVDTNMAGNAADSVTTHITLSLWNSSPV